VVKKPQLTKGIIDRYSLEIVFYCEINAWLYILAVLCFKTKRL